MLAVAVAAVCLLAGTSLPAGAWGWRGSGFAGAHTSAATSPHKPPSHHDRRALPIQHLTLDGRAVDLLAPDGAARGIVVLLHPLHGTPARVEQTTGLAAFAHARGWVLAVPSGVGRSWNAGLCCKPAIRTETDDVGWLFGFVATLQKRFGTQLPVALVGQSNGGMLAFAAGCAGMPHLRLVVVVSGNLEQSTCPHPASTWLWIRGDQDRLVPAGGSDHQPELGTPLLSDQTGLDLLADAMRCRPVTAADPWPASLVRDERWGCSGGHDIEIIRLRNSTHQWPRPHSGQPVDATAQAVAALSRVFSAP
jgi:polyhydroxybutyrate depolymerase